LVVETGWKSAPISARSSGLAEASMAMNSLGESIAIADISIA
jgi:hypothetical protein